MFGWVFINGSSNVGVTKGLPCSQFYFSLDFYEPVCTKTCSTSVKYHSKVSPAGFFQALSKSP